MKMKKLLILTLSFIIGIVLSVPVIAKDITKTEITKDIKNEITHKHIIQNIEKTNIIENKCTNILTAIKESNKQTVTKLLNNITVEDFYSERACIETIHKLLESTFNNKDMRDITKQFINKFKHPDNLIVSYMRQGGSFYKLSLLADWANSEALYKPTETSLNFANFLIAEGADINSEFEFITNKTSLKNFIYNYGSDEAINLIKKAEEQTQNNKNVSDSLRSQIVSLINKNDVIIEKCDNIYDSILNGNKRALTKYLDTISIEDFYSERHCIDNIYALVEQTLKGKDMRPLTKPFIKKFGSPDNLIISTIDSNGKYYYRTLLAELSSLISSQAEPLTPIVDYTSFLIKNGASVHQEIKQSNKYTQTFILPGKNIQ